MFLNPEPLNCKMKRKKEGGRVVESSARGIVGIHKGFGLQAPDLNH